MTRVLFVNNSLAMGGIETMIVDMIRLLAGRGIETEVAVFEQGGVLESTLEERGIPVHALGKRHGLDPGLPWRIARLARSRGITAIHSHNFSAWLYCALGRRFAPGVTHVHTEHSSAGRARRKLAERALGTLTDHVAAVSGHVQDVLTRQCHLPAAKVQLIHNGVNLPRFAPSAARRRDSRAALGIGEDEVVIGIVARLAPVKNHALLLRAFAQLPAPPARLLVVGGGPERAALDVLAAELGLDQRILFAGERRDTEAMYAAMDIYALSSTSEGMNLTLLEAMASGLPVVATRVGGNPEIVVDRTTGLLVPSGDVAGLAASLAALVADPQRRTSQGAAGRASVADRFDEQRMIDRYIRLYAGKRAHDPS